MPGVSRQQEHRHAAMGLGVRIGDREDHEERRVQRVGGEELVAREHPVVAVPRARQMNCVGSAPACGSVIENAENSSPSSSGRR